MQKKKGDIRGFAMLVFIIEIAINAPKKYEPLSPRKIEAFGKLYFKNANKIKIPLSIKKAKS